MFLVMIMRYLEFVTDSGLIFQLDYEFLENRDHMWVDDQILFF